MKPFVLLFCGAVLLTRCPLEARSSLLNSDPEVVYFEGALTELSVMESTAVFGDKNAQRRIGVFLAGAKVQLIGMSEKGYKVKGLARHGMVTGWVSQKSVTSRDPDFAKNLKAYYARSIEIRELIEAEEVAIGMTIEEVQQSIGLPTRQESRVTKDGCSGQWEYVKSEEQKHYVNSVDQLTGQVFRRYSHTTIEVREKLTLEFENDVVTAISSLKDDSGGNVKIIVPPVIFRF